MEPLAGAAKKNDWAVEEVRVQGSQRDAVVTALEKRGLDRRWVEMADKTKGKGRGGRCRLRSLVSVHAKRRWCRTGISPPPTMVGVSNTRYTIYENSRSPCPKKVSHRLA